MTTELLKMDMAIGSTIIGAAFLVVDAEDEESEPTGYYAVEDDESWTEDMDYVEALLHGETDDPHVDGIPVQSFTLTSLPDLPEGLTAT